MWLVHKIIIVSVLYFPLSINFTNELFNSFWSKHSTSISFPTSKFSVLLFVPFSSFSEKSEPCCNPYDIMRKPGLQVNDWLEPVCLEERKDLDISPDSCEWDFEVRLGSDFLKTDLEERTESDINLGCFAPEFDLSSEPGLVFPNRINMMMKSKKRNMNEEFEAVLLTNSKTKSIIIFTINKHIIERERYSEERLFVRKWLFEKSL